MGQIQKQSIKGTVYTYIGITIGFLTSGLLFPRFFTTDQIGLVNVIVSYAIISAQFATLGFNGVTNRLFPFFRNVQKKHYGFLNIGTIITAIGVLLAIVTLIILNNTGNLSTSKSEVLSEYFPAVFFLIAVIAFFNLFDNYTRVMYNAVVGTMLKEFVQRFFILIAIILFIFSVVNFKGFFYLYLIAFSVPLLGIMFYLQKKGLFLFGKISIPEGITVKEMISVASFSIFSGLAGVLTVNIDRIMVQNYVGLSNAGIYTIMFFFGSMVAISARSLIKISSTYLADAWKDNDIKTIKDIYRKSVINQTIIGLFILLIIWANIDNVFPIIGDKYLPGKYVVLLIGIAYLTDMIIGTAAAIIATSKEYKKITYIIIIQGILVIITNIIFIKMYGLIGAAIGSLISKSISNILKVATVKWKFGLLPYDFKIIIVIIAGIISYISVYFIDIQNVWINILVKSVPLTIIYGLLISLSKASNELNIKNIKKLLSSFK